MGSQNSVADSNLVLYFLFTILFVCQASADFPTISADRTIRIRTHCSGLLNFWAACRFSEQAQNIERESPDLI
jgi:hypothetical protein